MPKLGNRQIPMTSDQLKRTVDTRVRDQALMDLHQFANTLIVLSIVLGAIGMLSFSLGATSLLFWITPGTSPMLWWVLFAELTFAPLPAGIVAACYWIVLRPRLIELTKDEAKK